MLVFIATTPHSLGLRGFPEAKSIRLEEKLRDVSIEMNKSINQ